MDFTRGLRLEFDAARPRALPLPAASPTARSAAAARCPAVLNAANEEAVAAFLDGRIPFTAIAECDRGRAHAARSSTALAAGALADVLAADAWSRARRRPRSWGGRPPARAARVR